jgi:hypothetical protein
MPWLHQRAAPDSQPPIESTPWHESLPVPTLAPSATVKAPRTVTTLPAVVEGASADHSFDSVPAAHGGISTGDDGHPRRATRSARTADDLPPCHGTQALSRIAAMA